MPGIRRDLTSRTQYNLINVSYHFICDINIFCNKRTEQITYFRRVLVTFLNKFLSLPSISKTTVMKKYLLPILLLFISFTSLAQNEEQHSAEFNWGEKNAVYVIIGVILVIVLVIIWLIKRKKKPPTQ